MNESETQAGCEDVFGGFDVSSAIYANVLLFLTSFVCVCFIGCCIFVHCCSFMRMHTSIFTCLDCLYVCM